MALAETQRLTLREMERGDAVAIQSVFNDDYAHRFYPEMTNEAAAIEWIDRNRERYQRDGFGLWAIIDKTSGALIGDCGPTWQDAGGTRVLEIGYHIASQWRGSGYALEAARAAMAFGFARTTEPLIGSIVATDNASSASVARRLHHDVRSYVNARGLDRFLFFTRRERYVSS
ncbi:GNAT family N-acetyltransferase [Aminobacter aminovorans]|uniref:GCN5-related N-acetyltransferase n=1 Tax=Aminobacter aminovorans TaxID=83263 RepID=A0AAC8YQD4_AMIAI|nr:GNAT family N-acetyltransferase [Aminobacter aminovorans]AMS42279.1 GCN5-related N-acetyltransferase [Aminobacter aminovorans]MBB3709130.1 RimJ/RimL family protein N-acetyltransferase [Aminobacter aminovorans]WMC94688.1 GNAT family N-acetyltransferase [Aminobacter aminovorans]